MTRKGEKPTGVFHKKAKATDQKEPKNSRSEVLAADYSIKDLVGNSANDNKEEEKEEEEDDILLQAGIELRSVSGIGVRSEDVGNALQFLEFCFVFEEILELEKGEPENVLQDIIHGETARPALTTRFHIRLLSLLQESTTLSPSDGENLWFQRLKKCFSKTQSLLKSSEVHSLLRAADYDSLNASEKLRVLILLCDEVLGTEKIRNWIENENNELLKRVKEAKRKAHTARGKEKSLKQKMKEDVKKAIIAKDGAPLSISEHEAIVSDIRSEAAQAHAEVLEAEDILTKRKKTRNALRIEPLFTEHCGKVYWKLNSSEQSYVLQQNIGKGDTLTLDEKWYALDASSIEMIEKHISSRGKKSRKPRAPEASSSQPRTESGSA
ncbi:adenylate kinase [Handroanthus impetiginosus]|uniref:Adenylate kinase n=1 Tax=Handroanthus impetiginosus TaxID=429701 RepID=A0A2G9G9S7_9LAMI|nr:adenylate kinase [Handroanthus impetiginosus]